MAKLEINSHKDEPGQDQVSPVPDTGRPWGPKRVVLVGSLIALAGVIVTALAGLAGIVSFTSDAGAARHLRAVKPVIEDGTAAR